MVETASSRMAASRSSGAKSRTCQVIYTYRSFVSASRAALEIASARWLPGLAAGGSSSVEKPLGGPVDAEVLGFLEFFEAVAGAFAAEAALFDAAEWGGGVGHHPPVDADHSGIDVLSETHGALQLSGVNVGGKAHFRGVDEIDQFGVVLPSDDRRDGAKNLVAEDVGIRGDVDQHGRWVEPALAFGDAA